MTAKLELLVRRIRGRRRPGDRYSEEKRRRGVNETLNALPADPHGDTRLDRALKLGLRGEPSGFTGCNWCHDLPWRRHRSGCPGCGLPYADEVLEHEIETLQSSYPVEEMDPC